MRGAARIKAKTTRRGDFFAIDAAIWPKVAAQGMNAMVAYLVLARGTGGDQITTSWSVNAIEAYTGVSRPAARAAIKKLESAKLLTVVSKGSRPRYRLIVSPPGDQPPRRIWLPNSLIDGVAGNTAAPVELVRQSQNPEALMLLVMFYEVHDLAAYGGVHWGILRQNFTRERAGEWSENVVWRFTRCQDFQSKIEFFKPCASRRSAENWDKAFRSAHRVLKNLGLIDYVAHLIEADNDEAAMVHPFGWGSGEDAERRLAVATHREGWRLLGRDLESVDDGRNGAYVAAKKHLTEIAMVGLLRLKYKPHTAATAAWIARLDEWRALAVTREANAENCDRFIERAA